MTLRDKERGLYEFYGNGQLIGVDGVKMYI